MKKEEQRKWEGLIDHMTNQLNEGLLLPKADEIVERILRKKGKSISEMSLLEKVSVTQEALIMFTGVDKVRSLVKEEKRSKKSRRALVKAESEIRRSLETRFGDDYHYYQIVNQILEDKNSLTTSMKKFFTVLRDENYLED